MAVRSGFFNSIAGDRKYLAERFAEYFASFIGNGVFPQPLNGLQVISNDNMTITVKAGKIWINGYILINDDDYILAIDPADGLLNRIDRIVARYDVVDREIRLEVKKGTFASGPVAPTLQRDADAYELGLADILVSAGVVSIVANKITDLRSDTDLCGKVDSLIAGDINSLVAAFNEHKENIASKAEYGHINLETFKTYKKINQIVLGEEVAQLDVDLSGYSEIIVIGKNIKTTNAAKVQLRINNISTSMYSTSFINQTAILNNTGTTAVTITSDNGYVHNSHFSSFEIHLNKLLNSTSGEFVFYNEQDGILGLCYGKFKCNFSNEALSLNIFNSDIGSGYKFLIGSTFEIWGR